MRLFVRAEKLAARVSAWLDRHPSATLALASVFIAASTLSMAASKPLWHDEIFTVLLARLGVENLWTATLSGVDLTPPLNTVLTRVAVLVGGENHVAIRIPPILGFCLAAAVVFEFVRRRSNTLIALTAVLLLCFTAAYRYAYEARGYGLMMGAAALSLFTWAEAAAGRRRGLHLPLLLVALTAGYWSQYNGLFAAAPIVAGELVRSARNRRIDAAIWAAIGISLLTVIPLLPLMRVAAENAPTFWQKASVTDLFPTYAFILNALVEPAFLWAGAIGLLFAVLVRRLRISRVDRRLLPRPEVAALAVSVALPAVQILAALATTGVFVARYGLVSVPAICIALALVIARVTRATVAHVAFAAALTASLAATVRLTPSLVNPARQRPALMRLLVDGHAVVVTGGLVYLQLWYYTPPGMREHLYYLAHPDAALERTGSDTIDRGLLGLTKWAAVPAMDPNAFVATHPEFFVYSAGSGWVVGWLREDDAQFQKVDVELGASILAVRSQPSSGR